MFKPYVIVNENGMFLKYYNQYLVFETKEEAQSVIQRFSLESVRIMMALSVLLEPWINFKEVKEELLK